MSYFKVFTFMVRLCVGIIVVLLIWKPFVTIVFALEQGPDARCDLGGNYEMWGPPPWVIVYWPSKDYAFERIISEPVLEFALAGPWIIGRTEKDWFGIHKDSHQVHYPRSKEQLQTITGLEISSIHMETDPMPYLIVRPRAAAAKTMANRICWGALFVLPTTLAFAPILLRRATERCNKARTRNKAGLP
jgi:hypothetical protein